MTKPDDRDIEQIKPRVRALETCGVQRRTTPKTGHIVLSAAAGVSLGLHKNLRSSRRGILIRHLFHELGLDQQLALTYRLEHKLVQGLVFARYWREYVPTTFGWSTFMETYDLTAIGGLVVHDRAWVIKRGIGFNSGYREEIFRYNGAVIGEPTSLDDVARTYAPAPRRLEEEAFVVQQRIVVDLEYRVHTLEGRVVDALTFRKGDITSGERKEANSFVQKLMDMLPAACVRGTFCGWDIARTAEGAWHVIECNFSGVYPNVERGYHCSGLLSGWHGQCFLLSRLIRFIEDNYNVRITVELTDSGDSTINDLYRWLAYEMELFNSCERCELLASEIAGRPWVVGSENWEEAAIPFSIRGMKQFSKDLMDVIAVGLRY